MVLIMIYLTFSEWVQKEHNVPNLVSVSEKFMASNLELKPYADEIFKFTENSTHYYKTRTGSKYQYTEDERIMVVLKAQPYS